MSINFCKVDGAVPVPKVDGETVFMYGDCYGVGQAVAKNVIVSAYYKNGGWWLVGSSGMVEVRPKYWAAQAFILVD